LGYCGGWGDRARHSRIASYYQTRLGGVLSSAHEHMFRAAIPLPMAPGVLYFPNT